MKFALFSSFFVLAITTANAGPGASKIATADIISNLPKNSSRVLKSTKGYRPPEPSKPIQFQYEKMDRKVKFLDENHERYIPYSSKSTSTSHVQKRSFHTKLKTKGYEPKEKHEISQLYTLDFPKKLEYLDETHEVFRTPPGFQKMLDESLKRYRKDQYLSMKKEKK